MKKVVLFGTGLFAAIIHSYLRHDSPYEVVAFTVDGDHQQEDSLYGLPVVAFEDVASIYPPPDHGMMIAVGYQRMNWDRSYLYFHYMRRDSAQLQGRQKFEMFDTTSRFLHNHYTKDVSNEVSVPRDTSNNACDTAIMKLTQVCFI